MANYFKYYGRKVESKVDLWLKENAGILPISKLEAKLKDRFGCVPLHIVDETIIKKLNRDTRLENRVDGENVYYKIFNIAEELRQTYERARAQGRIRKYCNGRYNFEYAIIAFSEVPKELHLHAGGDLGDAFAGYQRQWWSKPIPEIIANKIYIFVVGDRIPTEFQEFAALHEYTELLTNSHREATQYEFQKVSEKGDEFLDKFTKWWISYLSYHKKNLEELDQENKDALKEILPQLSIRILEQKGIL